MLIYFIVIIAICLIALLCFSKNPNDRKRTIFLFLSFSILFLIMGFRDNTVGTDTQLYCNIFKNNYLIKEIKDIFISGDSSPIYTIYNYIIGMISHDCNFIKLANSFIICFLTALFIKKNTKHVFISTFLFLTLYHFFSSMNITRQYIAVMIVANAFVFVQQKKATKYILCCLIAIGIHNTAVISLALLPLIWIKLNKKNIIIYIISIFLIFSLLPIILNLFAVIFPHYSLYFENNMMEEVGKNRKIIITIIYIFLEITMCYIFAKKIKHGEDMKYYFIINILSIILGLLSLKNLLLSRMEIYFSIFSIIYIPTILSKFKQRNILYFVLILCMIIPMYIQLNSNNSGVTPYKTWLLRK